MKTKIGKKKPFKQGQKTHENAKRTDNTKNNNHIEEENVIDENHFKRLQEIARDAAEITKLLTNIAKRIMCTLHKKKQRKQKRKQVYIMLIMLR